MTEIPKKTYTPERYSLWVDTQIPMKFVGGHSNPEENLHSRAQPRPENPKKNTIQRVLLLVGCWLVVVVVVDKPRRGPLRGQ